MLNGKINQATNDKHNSSSYQPGHQSSTTLQAINISGHGWKLVEVLTLPPLLFLLPSLLLLPGFYGFPEHDIHQYSWLQRATATKKETKETKNRQCQQIS